MDPALQGTSPRRSEITGVLFQALPYLRASAAYGLSSLLSVMRSAPAVVLSAGNLLIQPIAAPLPIFAYIFAPVIIVLQVLLGVVVYAPLRGIAFVSGIFYPLYVFLGVACITGGLLGFCARILTRGLARYLPPAHHLPPSSNETEVVGRKNTLDVATVQYLLSRYLPA
ncbi:hypothetical protein R3P38DRAFT_2862418 [Favolaschia claudopus]|uniref:Transmembrane protein n=1 Tax=Favolaschia claudopus TaxID=2862362 RepID=A0AAW0DFY7_9AGAR